jgi:hypothetical protein
MRLSETNAGVTTFFEGASGTGWLKRGGLRQLNLIVIKSKTGALLLMGKSPTKVRWNVGVGGWLGSTAVPVWVLKKSVTLPARPWAVPALQKNKPYILEQFRLGAVKALVPCMGRVACMESTQKPIAVQLKN